MSDDKDGPQDELAYLEAELKRLFEGNLRRDERLAALQELTQSCRRIERARHAWTEAFDAIRDPVFLHDKDFRIVRANHAYAARAGMPIREIIGKLYWQVFPKDTGPLPCCLRARGNAEESEEEVSLANGEVLRSRTFSIRDEQGKYRYSVHILENVTERKLTENALRESEERYRSLFENMLEGFAYCKMLFKNGTAQDFIYIVVNSAFERLTGLKDVAGKKVSEVIPGIQESNPELFQIYSRVALTGKPEKFETYLDSLGIWFSIAVYSPGKEYFIAIFDNITERKRLEQSLRRTNHALRSLRAGTTVLIHATDETQLLNDMCRAIVESGSYRMAWIGYIEQDERKTVRPMAHAGPDEGYIEALRITWADSDRGRGPTGTAIRSGKTQLIQNILTDPAFAPWREEAIRRGYKSKISFPLRDGDEVFSVLSIYSAEVNAFTKEEIALLEELANDLAFGVLTLRMRVERDRFQEQHLRGVERLKQALVGTIQAVATTVEKRDPYTAGHQQRVAALCVAIASELGLDPERIEGLRLGALIHDIGKIYIPAEILNRPGKLSRPEFDMIKSHPQVGYDIIKDVQFSWPIAEMILQHHERLDGSGYPKGLKGEAIIYEARILAVADVIEAMSSHRPYRPARGVEQALEEMRRNRGRYYDPEVVDACLRLFEQGKFQFNAASFAQ